mmetsp:Transcript_43957/g.133916  ORF Transcript_43957/g.133916 Transcript_43957/m.133916 type:complete len:235 (+) Transcript_43957:543-1247(+)
MERERPSRRPRRPRLRTVPPRRTPLHHHQIPHVLPLQEEVIPVGKIGGVLVQSLDAQGVLHDVIRYGVVERRLMAAKVEQGVPPFHDVGHEMTRGRVGTEVVESGVSAVRHVLMNVVDVPLKDEIEIAGMRVGREPLEHAGAEGYDVHVHEEDVVPQGVDEMDGVHLGRHDEGVRVVAVLSRLLLRDVSGQVRVVEGFQAEGRRDSSGRIVGRHDEDAGRVHPDPPRRADEIDQ